MYFEDWTPGEDPTGMFCMKCQHKQEIDYDALFNEGVQCEACGHLATQNDPELNIYPFRRP